MKNSPIKNIAIVCGYSFPHGLAPTSRILAYSKGLVDNGVNVDVFVYFPTDSVECSLPVDGEIYGIKYHYPYSRTYSRHRLMRLLSHAYYSLICLYRLIAEHRKRKFDYVFLSTDWFRILYLFIPVIKLFGLKSVFIADEFPVPIRVYLKESIPKYKKLLFKYILKGTSGMVFMTNKLSSFYNEIVNKPSFILPSITDISRFKEISMTEKRINRILCYMGNMELSKDNVDNIIEAFSLIKNKYSDLELHLYGDPSVHDSSIIKNLIDKLDLTKKILLMGRVNNDQVPSILAKSTILVSSQPQTRRAEGGFPTKLGEYMASGIPILLTDVGEIGKYVTNGENVFLVDPNDPVKYAKKLEYILDNYYTALTVAQNAMTYASNTFDPKVISGEMLAFLNMLDRKNE